MQYHSRLMWHSVRIQSRCSSYRTLLWLAYRSPNSAQATVQCSRYRTVQSSLVASRYRTRTVPDEF
eukprot:scaffold301740_cov17-Prasinocladus_malaysianus.AAC.1